MVDFKTSSKAVFQAIHDFKNVKVGYNYSAFDISSKENFQAPLCNQCADNHIDNISIKLNRKPLEHICKCYICKCEII